MTYTDDHHEVAKILKDFDERLSNLEEKSRTSTNPNLLRTEAEQVDIGDRVEDVTTKDLDTARYGDMTDTGGYQTATWGTYA
jgi:hypothetical protein